MSCSASHKKKIRSILFLVFFIFSATTFAQIVRPFKDSLLSENLKGKWVLVKITGADIRMADSSARTLSGQPGITLPASFELKSDSIVCSYTDPDGKLQHLVYSARIMTGDAGSGPYSYFQVSPSYFAERYLDGLISLPEPDILEVRSGCKYCSDRCVFSFRRN